MLRACLRLLVQAMMTHQRVESCTVTCRRVASLLPQLVLLITGSMLQQHLCGGACRQALQVPCMNVLEIRCEAPRKCADLLWLCALNRTPCRRSRAGSPRRWCDAVAGHLIHRWQLQLQPHTRRVQGARHCWTLVLLCGRGINHGSTASCSHVLRERAAYICI